MDSNQSRAVGGTIWVYFRVHWPIWGASGRLKSQIQAILGQILTFPDPPCQLSQIFMVWNGLYRCPTNRTTCFMFNSHHLGAFYALQSQFQRYSGEVVFAAMAVQILKILLLGHFLQMFCMKCVLCINISRPEAKWYEYITYWLISSRIANCFELTATLT